MAKGNKVTAKASQAGKGNKGAALKAGAGDARKVSAPTKAKADKVAADKGRKAGTLKASPKAKAALAKAKAEYVRKPGAGVEVAPDAMLRLAVEGNPKREGSDAWHRYQAMLHAYAKAGGRLTVAAAIDAGYRADDIRWGCGKGYHSVDNAQAGDGFDKLTQAKVTPSLAKATLSAAKAETKTRFDAKRLRG
jgi:hypothetical protein